MKRFFSAFIAILVVTAAISSLSGCTNSAKQQSTGSSANETVFGSCLEDAGIDIGIGKIKVKNQMGKEVSPSMQKYDFTQLKDGASYVTVQTGITESKNSEIAVLMSLQAYKTKECNAENAVCFPNGVEGEMVTMKELKQNIVWQNETYTVYDMSVYEFKKDAIAAAEDVNKLDIKDREKWIDLDWLKTARQQVVDALAKK